MAPCAIESTNCEPPYAVHASTKTTIASGQPSSANRASTRSTTDGSSGWRCSQQSIRP